MQEKKKILIPVLVQPLDGMLTDLAAPSLRTELIVDFIEFVIIRIKPLAQAEAVFQDIGADDTAGGVAGGFEHFSKREVGIGQHVIEVVMDAVIGRDRAGQHRAV